MYIESAKRYRWLNWAAVFAALALAAYVLHLNRAFYHDDAYITLRYAHNILLGNGAVWNPGEYVQGYTNFLQMVLIVLFGYGGADLVWASRAIGVLACVGLILAMLVLPGFVHRETEGELLWALPVVLVATSCPLLVWALGGLEGALFALLTTVGSLLLLAALDRPRPAWLLAGSGGCLGLGYLTRPDGAIFIAVSLLWLLAASGPKRLRNSAAFLLPCLVIILPYMVWQLAYYGDIVPNTFYAKGTGFSVDVLVRGAEYIGRYAVKPPFLPILAALVLAWGIVARNVNRRAAYLALLSASYLLFVVYIGGDKMPAFRHVIPVVAPLSYMLYIVLTSVIAVRRRWAAALILAAVLALASGQLLSRNLNPRQEDPAAYLGTMVGKYIASAWPSGSLIALSTAGSTPYYITNNRYIDMLGLNDWHIAHRHVDKIELPWQNEAGHLKGDGAYVLARNPDYIIVGPAEGALITDPWFLSDLEMSRDPSFATRYEMHQVNLDRNGVVTTGRGQLFTYYRKVSR